MKKRGIGALVCTATLAGSLAGCASHPAPAAHSGAAGARGGVDAIPTGGADAAGASAAAAGASADAADDPDGVDDADGTDGDPAVRDQRAGVPFLYTQTFSDGTAPVGWQVTVTAVSCGGRLFRNGADNPAYTSGNWSSDAVPPEHIDATPAPGWVFCRMDATMRNVGRSPATATENFGDLETDHGRYTVTDDDQTVARNLEGAADIDNGPFNPGMSTRVIKVWSVPAGTKPSAVLFPEDGFVNHTADRVAVS